MTETAWVVVVQVAWFIVRRWREAPACIASFIVVDRARRHQSHRCFETAPAVQLHTSSASRHRCRPHDDSPTRRLHAGHAPSPCRLSTIRPRCSTATRRSPLQARGSRDRAASRSRSTTRSDWVTRAYFHASFNVSDVELQAYSNVAVAAVRTLAPLLRRIGGVRRTRYGGAVCND